MKEVLHVAAALYMDTCGAVTKLLQESYEGRRERSKG